MLIIDMPMPSRCGECPLLYMDIVTCTVTGKDCTEYGAERPSWCPIKGVLPDEHGDLVDRDELKEKFCDDDAIDNYAREYIDAAQIIIAAERKDDGKTAD